MRAREGLEKGGPGGATDRGLRHHAQPSQSFAFMRVGRMITCLINGGGDRPSYMADCNSSHVVG